MLEKADERRSKKKRKISIRGTYFKTDDTDPIAIARALRKESKLGKREARLEHAEAKVGRR
ncbi:hypothetical protein M2202_005801 [Bradyrhizobium japonicum]|jgi:hypothetical protein|nr:hypothetical protein [Bradyrhizobium japonicum]MCP1787527.1 hypothetical protein [Bradyrhizobium japonicum]MCP1809403.1 hypothetical protein [Bradyrhizobium japonicum]MCP1818336.1 hypothetical protein [Bradyrhizobium japonicum]MCP1870154.1 hypothetical protein [Bradyrhizobium japonicum]